MNNNSNSGNTNGPNVSSSTSQARRNSIKDSHSLTRVYR